ncbi:MAG TPA: hypothetical protein VFE24_08580 [Pirellulales bacterium]|jgi:hypothetical protein|nr:hypothetical protein [Pirellulales bacterium]
MSWDAFSRFFSHANLPWIILWLGLIVLIVGLIALMRTHWGQSNPLRKCAVLSLLVHLLLAAYATTVEIVTTVSAGPPGDGGGNPCSVSLVGGDYGENGVEGTSDGIGPRPWERFANGPATLPVASELARAIEPAPTAPSRLVNELDFSAPSSTPIPLPSDAIASRVLEVTSDLPSPKRGASTAEPIDEVKPQKATAIVPVMPTVAAPDRVAIATLPPLTGPDPANLPATADAAPLTAIPSSIALPKEVTNLASLPPRAMSPAKVEPIGDPFGNGDGTPKTATWANTPNGATPTAPADAANIDPLTAVPTPYLLRVAPNHGGAVRRGGGSPEVEASVQSALEWLAANQNADGRWEAKRFGAGKERNVLGHDRHGAGARADTGVTGLALLALLGSGNTHREGKYSTTVRKGLEFLLNSQARDGNLGGDAETFAFMYCHGMATLSISEAYAMTHDSRLEPFVHRAIDFTVSMQHPQAGGWRYQPNDTGDTSQLGWQLMSLKSAELAGIPIPQRTRDGMVRFLKGVTFGAHNGRASYRPDERASRTMTAEALVCRQFLGMERSNPASDEAGDFVLEELPSASKMNLYYWYYGSLSMYQLQGDYWRKWNDALQPALLKTQEAGGELKGSWSPDDDQWGGYGGRVYATAMATLCLEVYYRYLPLYGDQNAIAEKPHK